MKSGASEARVDSLTNVFLGIFLTVGNFSHIILASLRTFNINAFDKMAERIHLFKINRVSEANKVHILPSFSRKRHVIVIKMASDALK